MKFNVTSLKGCYTVEPRIMEDDRGWFTRVFCKEEIHPFAGDVNFVQINHSFNRHKGTFRGMHYQEPPHAEEKLIRCIAGAVVDFALDLRKNSPTFLKWIAVELSAANKRMIFIPKGFAHGFQTLQDNSELIYHHTAFYNPKAEKGLNMNDPRIKIELPVSLSVVSDRDKNHPHLDITFSGIEI